MDLEFRTAVIRLSILTDFEAGACVVATRYGVYVGRFLSKFLGRGFMDLDIVPSYLTPLHPIISASDTMSFNTFTLSSVGSRGRFAFIDDIGCFIVNSVQDGLLWLLA